MANEGLLTCLLSGQDQISPRPSVDSIYPVIYRSILYSGDYGFLRQYDFHNIMADTSPVHDDEWEMVLHVFQFTCVSKEVTYFMV